MKDISNKGLDLIKHFEGCKLEAYRDSVGIPTIGYGHIEGVQMGDVITQDEADLYLSHDVASKVDGVNRLVRADINQNQFDALVSFAYNLGLGALGNSTLLKMINAGSANAAGPQFLRWNKAGGVVLAGLTRRREAEKALYESPPTVI